MGTKIKGPTKYGGTKISSRKKPAKKKRARITGAGPVRDAKLKAAERKALGLKKKKK